MSSEREQCPLAMKCYLQIEKKKMQTQNLGSPFWIRCGHVPMEPSLNFFHHLYVAVVMRALLQKQMSKNPSYSVICLLINTLADFSSSNHVPSVSLKENELKCMSHFSLPPEINSLHKPGSEFVGFLPRLWGADFIFVRKLCFPRRQNLRRVILDR